MSKQRLKYLCGLKLLLPVWKICQKYRCLSLKSLETFASTSSTGLQVMVCIAGLLYLCMGASLTLRHNIKEAQLLAGNDGNFHAFPVSTLPVDW